MTTLNKRLASLASLLVPALAAFAPTASAALIENVVESGGDNEATDTIPAKWTGQTWDTTQLDEPLLATPIGTPFTVGTFGSEAPAFVDRAHRYLDDPGGTLPIPPYLVGQEYIMSGNDNRDNAAYRLDVTISARATVYMLIDNRLGAPNSSNADPPSFGPTKMQWILDQGWAPTANGLNRLSDPSIPDEVAFDEAADFDVDQWFSVYEKIFAPGTFSLSQADNAGQNMYGVVIVPAPITENPITSFDAIPLSIPPGGQAALSWIIHTAATSAGINQGVGNVLPLTTSGVGNASVTPATDTTYTLSVTSPAGNDSRTASVQVRPLGFFQAGNTLIAAGSPVTLSWRIRQDASATLTGVGSVAPHTAPDGTGSVVVNPSATTTYVLSSTASGRTEEASATVVLRPVGTQFALIDIGATGGQVEPGAVGGIVVGAGPHDTNGVDLAPVSLTSDTGDEFTIAIDNIDPSGIPIGGLDWRDRGNAPAAPLAFLVEDFVKNNLGMVHVTLGGLPAGTYDVISYHLDPDNSQCSNIRILVTDATRLAEDTNVLGDASYPDHPNNTNVPNVGGLTTGLADSKSAHFQITSNGTDAVMIYFDGNTDPIDDEVPLDGLWLTLATPAEPFDIVNVTRTAAGGSASVTIEFTSTPGRTYSVFASPDLVDWTTELSDNLSASAGATTTFTETNIPLNVLRRHYRVQRN